MPINTKDLFHCLIQVIYLGSDCYPIIGWYQLLADYRCIFSSYSSLDLVLTHWAYFTVCRFICACVCVFLSYCIYVILLWHGGVDLMGLKPNPYPIFLECFDIVGWVIWPVPNVTYNVFGGTLSITQPILCDLTVTECVRVCVNHFVAIHHTIWTAFTSLPTGWLWTQRLARPQSALMPASRHSLMLVYPRCVL